MIWRILSYLLLCLTLFAAGFLYSWKYPEFKVWALRNLEKVARQEAQTKIRIGDLSFKFFPPAVVLKSVSATPLGDLGTQIAPVTVEEVSVSAQLSPLLAGRLAVGEIVLRGVKTSLVIKAKTEDPKKAEEPFRFPWARFMRLPFRAVRILDLECNVHHEAAKLLSHVSHFDFELEKTDQAILLEVNAPDLWIKRKDIESSLTQAGLKFRILAQKEALQLAYFKFNHGSNYAIATGLAKGNIPELKFNSLNGRSLIEGDLLELANWGRNLFPNVTIPEARGKIRVQVDSTQVGSGEPQAMAQIQLSDLQVEQYYLGEIRTDLHYKNQALSSDLVEIHNPAGVVKIQDIQLGLTGNLPVSLRVLPVELEVKKLLIALSVGDTPIRVPVTGRVPCEGTLKPVNLNCSGDINVHDLWVHTEPEKKTIVAINSLRAVGTMNVNTERIEFGNTQLYVGESSGWAWGQVSFEKGFKFGYHSDRLNFSDIKSIADLKFEGSIRVSGTTQGDGHTGTIDLHGTTDSFWFEDYGIGSADADIQYENSMLHVKNIRGQFNNSIFRGEADLNLHSPISLVAKAQSDHASLSDLLTMFSRKAQVPVTAEGVGKFIIEVSGPTEFTKLTYNLKSQVPSGFIAGESFKDLFFDVHARDGVVKTDHVSLKKGEALIEARGDGFPDGNIKLNIRSRNIQIEDFDTLKVLGLNMTGVLNVDMSLGDYVLKPTTDLRISATNTTLNGEVLPDSKMGMVITPHELRGQGQLFNKVTSQFIFPLSEMGRFRLLLKVQDYDFSPLFAFIGNANSRKDYETRLTADLNLNAEKGGFLKSTGEISVPLIHVRHGIYQMRNPQPWKIVFDEGVIKAEEVQLKGDGTQLSLKGQRNLNETLNYSVNGTINLNLLTFLTPFFQDMRGDLSLATQITGKFSEPQLLGSAFIDQGFIKLPEFPHAFEDVKADILFSQARALVNRFKARFASGTLTATGTVAFRGLKDFPVDLNAEAEKVTFTVPEGLTTRGSARFNISGHWFPYLIKGDYNITGGLYTKNFGPDPQSEIFVKRSKFLPEQILVREFEPVEFQINNIFPQGVWVKNNMLDSEVRGEIQLRGTTRRPLLLGEVNAVAGGKVLFRDTPFTISTASVRFNNPNENNPYIYANASARVRDHDISLLVRNPLDKIKVELSSTPPMTEQSIISLLALGIADDQIDQSKSGDEQAYVIGSAALSDNPLQKQVKKSLGVNMRFTPRVDETRNTIDPAVVAEKEWTPRIITSTSRTLGERQTQDVKVEYKLNRNFSVLGTYEGRDNSNTTTTSAGTGSSAPTSAATEVFGLDLQFQTDYK